MDAKFYIRSTLVVAGLTLSSWVQPAGADTFNVTKFEDSYDGKCNQDCSLRDAIHVANNTPGTHQVNLSPGTYLQTIPGYENKNQGGDWDVSANVTLIGAGPDKTVIDAKGLDRIFEVLPGASLTLQGVSLINGHASGIVPYGGAIRNRGTLTLQNCLVKNNLADTAGGGIYNDQGAKLFVINTSFRDNTATSGNGGAILEDGVAAQITNSTFANNKAVNGGCLYFVQGATSLIQFNGSENTATNEGGCLWVGSAKMVGVSDLSIMDNTAPAGKDCLGILMTQGKYSIGEPIGCKILVPEKLVITPPSIQPIGSKPIPTGGGRESSAGKKQRPRTHALPIKKAKGRGAGQR